MDFGTGWALFFTVLLLPPRAQLDVVAMAAADLVGDLPTSCPDDMVLVRGTHCSAQRYDCVHRVAEGAGCAEYRRIDGCSGTLRARRFCIDRYEYPNRLGAQPRVDTSWNEAVTLCEARGRRLCRRSEWSMACEGRRRSPYPWGWVRHPSPCNIDRPVIDVDRRRMDDPRTRKAEIARLWQAHPSGTKPGCSSDFGVFDMTGNVDEWTDNREEGSGFVSTLNGGYWGPVRNTCRLTTKAHGPGFSYYQIGFRCCADATDGSRAAPMAVRSAAVAPISGFD